MKSRSKISRQLEKKFNPLLVRTLIAAKKNPAWLKVASVLSGPRKNFVNLNLDEINKKIGDEKILVVPGKVLSQGKIEKKVKIVAFDFSEKARSKLTDLGIESIRIIEEIKSNPKAKGIKILEY